MFPVMTTFDMYEEVKKSFKFNLGYVQVNKPHLKAIIYFIYSETNFHVFKTTTFQIVSVEVSIKMRIKIQDILIYKRRKTMQFILSVRFTIVTCAHIVQFLTCN